MKTAVYFDGSKLNEKMLKNFSVVAKEVVITSEVRKQISGNPYVYVK